MPDEQAKRLILAVCWWRVKWTLRCHVPHSAGPEGQGGETDESTQCGSCYVTHATAGTSDAGGRVCRARCTDKQKQKPKKAETSDSSQRTTWVGRTHPAGCQAVADWVQLRVHT